MAAMLTGGGAESSTRGASVDQYIASRLGDGVRFASLEFGVHTSAWGGNVQTRMCYRAAGTFAPPDDDPASLYRRLFAGLSSGPELSPAQLRRRSSLDLVRNELTALRGAVGTDEQRRLDVHLDALRTVERSLAETPLTGCVAPGMPSLDPRDNDAFPLVGRAQTDLLLAALQCGMTRVASIQWSHTVSPTVCRWVGNREGHHTLSHMADTDPAGVQQFVDAERWFAEQFALLVERLAALPEPGGSGRMLDHTLVLWAKELGDSRLHECRAVPFVLAGGAGGRLATGRYLRFEGEPHQRLLVTVCQAMGLDNPTFGDASQGTGPLRGVLS